MAHDDVNDLKQRVSNESVQIMRLEEKVRSLTKERDHWIAEAADARALNCRLFDEARKSGTGGAVAALVDPKEEDSVERSVTCEQHFVPYACPQSWWQRIIGRLFA